MTTVSSMTDCTSLLPSRDAAAIPENGLGVLPLHILLIHGWRLPREALASALLQWPRIADVSAVADCAEGVRAFREELPDLVLIVVDRLIGDVAAAVRAMRKVDPEAQIIILAAKQYDLDVREAMKGGVAGYLVGCPGLSALAAAINAVAEGRHVFTEPIRRLLSWPDGRPVFSRVRSEQASGLFRREFDILFLLSKGASLKEAAAALGISSKTADHHRGRLMRRLGIHDRVEVARFAIREGLVSPT